MHFKLTPAGRRVRNTLLKGFFGTTCAILVLRGCIDALSDAGRRSTVTDQATVQPAPSPEPDPFAPWKDIPIGATISGPWRNNSAEPVVLHFGGKRTVVFSGEIATIQGVVVYDRRLKCKALRLLSEDDKGYEKRLYIPLSKPTPASFWDCTPDE
jgi:hypothetical protein